MGVSALYTVPLSCAVDLPSGSGIYCIRNLVNGKCLVGQTAASTGTKGFRQRCSYHRYRLRRGNHDNIHVQRAWDWYGESAFVVDVLEFVEDLSLLNERERFWILRLNTLNPRYGYNLQMPATGSERGTVSEETRRKQALRLVGNSNKLGKRESAETRARKSAIGRTRTYSEETRRKMSAWQVGRTPPPEQLAKAHEASSRTYWVTSPYGERRLIKNLSQFCRENGLLVTGMTNVASGRGQRYKGWGCERVSSLDEGA